MRLAFTAGPAASRALAALAAFFAPSAAAAEVMDKVGLPWGPHRLLVLALAAGLSAFLAWRPGPLRVATAVTLGVLWCATHFTWEPLYDAHLGPDIARELTSLELQAYRVLSPVEALAPLIAVAVVAWNRTRHRGGGAGP